MRADDKRKTFDAEPIKALKRFLIDKGMSTDDVERAESLPRNGVNDPGEALAERPSAPSDELRAKARASDHFARRHPDFSRMFPGGT